MNIPVKVTLLTGMAISLTFGVARAQAAPTRLISQTKTVGKLAAAPVKTPQTPTPDKTAQHTVNNADKRFMSALTKINLTEIKLGELAQNKAENAQVKEFGQKMINDHQQVQERLKALADSKSVSLPKDLDSSEKAALTRLSKLSGAQFDRAYMDQMTSGHKKAASLLKSEQNRSSSAPEVKEFAQNTLPGVEEHLKLATNIDKSLSGQKPMPVAQKNSAEKKTTTTH